jgi:hypothetical protein
MSMSSMPTTSRLFTESVTSGRQIAPSVEDGLSAAAVLDAAEQSALTKHWSQVPQIANQTSLWIPRMVGRPRRRPSRSRADGGSTAGTLR